MTSRTGTTDTPFLYNGRDGVMSDANGLYYMRARYYSPELKRFINADIVAGDISNAITLNRYAYANGNPVSNIDPFGLSADNNRGDSTPHMMNNVAAHEMSDLLNQLLLFRDRLPASLTGKRSVSFRALDGAVITYSVSASNGDGFIDFEVDPSELFDLLESMSLTAPAGDNFEIVGTLGNLEITYNVDINENASFSATISKTLTATTADFEVTTNYPNDISVSADIQYEKTKNRQSSALIPTRIPIYAYEHSAIPVTSNEALFRKTRKDLPLLPKSGSADLPAWGYAMIGVGLAMGGGGGRSVYKKSLTDDGFEAKAY